MNRTPLECEPVPPSALCVARALENQDQATVDVFMSELGDHVARFGGNGADGGGAEDQEPAQMDVAAAGEGKGTEGAGEDEDAEEEEDADSELEEHDDSSDEEE